MENNTPQEIPNAFKSKREFSILIETLALEEGISCVDAIIKYCSDNLIDVEEVSDLISRPLKDKLHHDFIQLNMLPKMASLDV